MEGVSTLTFPGQFRSLYHHFNVTVDHWKLQIHGITLMLKSSDRSVSFVKTYSYLCRRLLRITWRWHRSSTSSTVRWAAPSRWDCGVVRLSYCWERNFWTDEIHTCLQTASNVDMMQRNSFHFSSISFVMWRTFLSDVEQCVLFVLTSLRQRFIVD